MERSWFSVLEYSTSACLLLGEMGQASHTDPAQVFWHRDPRFLLSISLVYSGLWVPTESFLFFPVSVENSQECSLFFRLISSALCHPQLPQDLFFSWRFSCFLALARIWFIGSLSLCTFLLQFKRFCKTLRNTIVWYFDLTSSISFLCFLGYIALE